MLIFLIAHRTKEEVLMIQLVDLSGKTIVIAGASSGIGKQTAITLSKLGARLVLIARREEELIDTVKELDGHDHGYYVSDLSEVESISELVKTIVSDWGKIDGLVYAAGVGTSAPLKQLTPERVQSVFDINYFGFIEIVRQFSRKGRYNEGMRIVGISSIAAFCGDMAHTAYSASKAAMDATVRCIAKELAPKSICLNTVAPAMTRTRMYENFIARYGEDSASNDYILKRQYLGIAEMQDIANAIAFLISPAARFITGICLPVDGGYTTS